jgi:hypothetical protein
MRSKIELRLQYGKYKKKQNIFIENHLWKYYCDTQNQICTNEKLRVYMV